MQSVTVVVTIDKHYIWYLIVVDCIHQEFESQDGIVVLVLEWYKSMLNYKASQAIMFLGGVGHIG